MGCCLSKEIEDKQFEPAESRAASENIYEEPIMETERPWSEKITTNSNDIVLSVDTKFDDEKIAKDREETLMDLANRFLYEWS